jgi:hypothetical protein
MSSAHDPSLLEGHAVLSAVSGGLLRIPGEAVNKTLSHTRNSERRRSLPHRILHYCGGARGRPLAAFEQSANVVIRRNQGASRVAQRKLPLKCRNSRRRHRHLGHRNASHSLFGPTNFFTVWDSANELGCTHRRPGTRQRDELPVCGSVFRGSSRSLRGASANALADR